MDKEKELTDAEAIALAKATGKSRQLVKRFAVSDGRHGLWIDDDEFSYDAALRVTGDFETPEAKLAYLQALCDVLNENEDRIPWRNDGNTDPFFELRMPQANPGDQS